MVTVELRGRLGNQLFQYSLCRVMSERLGCGYSISPEWLGKDIFNCGLGEKPYSKCPVIFDEGVNAFNSDVFKVADGTHLFGFWQSEKYFKGYENNIRNWFELSVPDSDYIQAEYCTIHFRAQDGYLRENFVLPVSYFDKCKEYIRNKVGNHIQFVVVTDNPQLSKKYFPHDIIINNDMKTDLAILTHSKYKIISNSSFSWWAAWLGLPTSELVVAPKRWMNYNNTINQQDSFYPKDIITSNFTYI